MVRSKQTIIIPFRRRANREDNDIYDFLFQATDETQKWCVDITIDELNDSLIMKKTCQCPDFRMRHRDCKHIKEALIILTKFGVEMRENAN